MNTNKKDEVNLTPILIGFGAIILVIIIIFWRIHSDQNKSREIFNQQKTTPEKQKNEYTGLEVADLAKKISDNKKITIIDLRTAKDFKSIHIVDSQNFSLVDLKKNINSFSLHQEYIFVDTLGMTNSEKQALEMFKEKGFKNLNYLKGGISQWENQMEPTISFGNPYSMIDQSKVTYIDTTKLQMLLNQDKKSIYIIDVRNKDKFEQSHILGAVNIPLANLEKDRHQISQDKQIILYDDNGLMAFQGAVRLFDMGILNVSVLSDGFNTWKQKKVTNGTHGVDKY